MTNEQKADALRCARRIQDHLQTIAEGRLPLVPDMQLNLEKRRERADWELGFLLNELVPALPKDLRVSVQACLDLNKQIWSDDYRKAYHAERQKETSPTCLPAPDSF